MLQFETTKKIVANGSSTPIADGPISNSWHKVAMDQPLQPKASPQPFSNIPNNLNDGLKSMKKGFTSLMTSIDSALKSSPDDASDTVSIRSDGSSDSENYVLINMGADGSNEKSADAMFRVMEFQTEIKGNFLLFYCKVKYYK